MIRPRQSRSYFLMKIRRILNRCARQSPSPDGCHYKSPGQGAKSMTENQFLEDLSFYQRRFERLHRAIIKDMKQYINKNPAYDITFYKTVESFSANITITGEWVKLLRSFNSNKYARILRFPTEFNINNGVPDAKINPTGSGKNNVKICQ